jgi:O-antigen chain-terminating methyltransferase
MLETSNFEIDVDELMQKVKEEVANRQSYSLAEAVKFSSVSATTTVSNSYIEARLKDAEIFSQVPTKFPDKFNRFPFNLSKGIQNFFLKLYGFLFKKQQVVNFSLIHALREAWALNQQLFEQVTVLQGQLQEISDRLAATDEDLKSLESTNERLSINLTVTDERLRSTDERLRSTDERLRSTDERLRSTDERYIRNDNYLKNDLAQQKRLIALFLEEARQRLPEPFSKEQLQTFVNEEQHLLDAFYVAFEDRFRGSREEIISRLKVYLPQIAEAKVGKEDSPILDIGCGRGEWLKLLQESGYIARGIDINRTMLEQCRARGLEAIEGDAVAYLESLADASLGAVTGFHIIEHLPFSLLIKLLNEIVRVLQPGGLVIFETPNPQNVLVGSNNFYIDPSHLNPLPSPLSQFLLEHAGLNSVEVINLNPYEDSYKVSGSELAELFNKYFYGPQDYAVVGHKL